jgi:hypothetical protein
MFDLTKGAIYLPLFLLWHLVDSLRASPLDPAHTRWTLAGSKRNITAFLIYYRWRDHGKWRDQGCWTKGHLCRLGEMAGRANLKQVHVVANCISKNRGGGGSNFRSQERFFFYFVVQGGRHALNEEGAGRGYKGLMRAGIKCPRRPGKQTNVQTKTHRSLVFMDTWRCRRKVAAVAGRPGQISKRTGEQSGWLR